MHKHVALPLAGRRGVCLGGAGGAYMAGDEIARGEGACATSTVMGDSTWSSMAARDGRRGAAGAFGGGAMVAEGAGSGKGRAEMSLPPNLAADRG